MMMISALFDSFRMRERWGGIEVGVMERSVMDALSARGLRLGRQIIMCLMDGYI